MQIAQVSQCPESSDEPRCAKAAAVAAAARTGASEARRPGPVRNTLDIVDARASCASSVSDSSRRKWGIPEMDRRTPNQWSCEPI